MLENAPIASSSYGDVKPTLPTIKKKRKQLVACDGCRLRRVKCDKADMNEGDCSECLKKKLKYVQPSFPLPPSHPTSSQLEYRASDVDLRFIQPLTIFYRCTDNCRIVITFPDPATDSLRFQISRTNRKSFEVVSSEPRSLCTILLMRERQVNSSRRLVYSMAMERDQISPVQEISNRKLVNLNLPSRPMDPPMAVSVVTLPPLGSRSTLLLFERLMQDSKMSNWLVQSPIVSPFSSRQTRTTAHRFDRSNQYLSRYGSSPNSHL